MIRVVIDPGVFISALIGSRGGAPDLVVRAFVWTTARLILRDLFFGVRRFGEL